MAQETLQAIQNGEVDAFVVRHRGLFRVETLAAASTPYQVLVESIGDGALTIARGGVILYSNRPFAQKVADTGADVTGRSVSEWLELDGCELESLLERALGGEASQSGTLRSLSGTIPVAVTACALPSDGETTVFCLLLRDQSDRVEAQELRLERARLARQRAELDAICRCLPFAVLLARAPGSYDYQNPPTEKVFESFPELRSQVEAVILSVSQGTDVVGREAVLLTTGGSESTFRLYATPLVLEGTAPAVLVVLEDVTAQLQADRERERQEQLREVFVGMLGHDLRTPLGAIAAAATLLERWPAESDQVVQTAQRIQRAADRMKHLIDDMLDFTLGRVGGGIPLTPTPAHLHQVVNAAIEELEAGTRARVIVDVEGDVTGRWDALRLAQVLSNLLSNAVEYGSPSTPIRIGLDGTLADHVRLSVNNQGAPIPAAVIAHVFDAFRRGRSSATGGVGLGLYIAERIVSAHRGTISVHSTEGEGTTFTVELPRDA